MLSSIETFLNKHEDYQSFLKEAQQYSGSSSGYFNSFLKYSQLYGRLNPLLGVSFSASYFESSPIPGVFGNFA